MWEGLTPHLQDLKIQEGATSQGLQAASRSWGWSLTDSQQGNWDSVLQPQGTGFSNSLNEPGINPLLEKWKEGRKRIGPCWLLDFSLMNPKAEKTSQAYQTSDLQKCNKLGCLKLLNCGNLLKQQERTNTHLRLLKLSQSHKVDFTHIMRGLDTGKFGDS